MRAAKGCSHPDCPELQPCPTHQRKPWAGSTRRSELPSGWEKLRAFVLQRDPICTICHDALSTECHHTGDPNDHRLAALAGVCGECHKTETAKQSAAARARSA